MRTTGTSKGPSLAEISDDALLQLILRDDLPGFLMEVYSSEADRRMAMQDQQVMTTMDLPFLQGGEQ